MASDLRHRLWRRRCAGSADDTPQPRAHRSGEICSDIRYPAELGDRWAVKTRLTSADLECLLIVSPTG